MVGIVISNSIKQNNRQYILSISYVPIVFHTVRNLNWIGIKLSKVQKVQRKE